MRIVLLHIIYFVLISSQGNAQTPCDIHSLYENFIDVHKSLYNDEITLTINVIDTPSNSCIFELVRTNPMFIEYILKYYSSDTNQQRLLNLDDSVAMRKRYFDDLRQDPMFTNLMTEYSAKTIEMTMPKDSISLRTLLEVAVKYFSIQSLTDDGYYVGKVCSGLNDIEKTESKRMPFLEAFAFSSIMKNYSNETFSMHDDFVSAIKELYYLNLGLDRNEKLLRAQGAMYVLMKFKSTLQSMLLSEYKAQEVDLPFVLREP